MCQEVGVTEHVLLVHHKAEEGELRVVDVKDKLLEEPDRVEAVVSWRVRREWRGSEWDQTHGHLQHGTSTLVGAACPLHSPMKPRHPQDDVQEDRKAHSFCCPSIPRRWSRVGTSPTRTLTYNIRLVLAVVVLGAAHFHLHKGTHDAPPVLGKVPGAKDLWEEEEGEIQPCWVKKDSSRHPHGLAKSFMAVAGHTTTYL